MTYEEKDCCDCIYLERMKSCGVLHCVKYRWIYPASWFDEQVKKCLYYTTKDGKNYAEEVLMNKGW